MRDWQLSSGQEVTAEQVRRMQAQAAEIEPAATGIAWQQLGPYNIGGRVTDVVADPLHAELRVSPRLAGGGIWKTTDGGANWTSIWPDSEHAADGRDRAGQDGTLWAGTGRGQPARRRPDLLRRRRLQVDRQRRHLDQHGPARQRGDRPHRGRPDELEQRLRRRPRPHRPLGRAERGLYRTEDAGKTWELVLAPTTPTTGARSTSRSTRPTRDIVYAALWDHQRTNGTRTYGGVGSGLFRSDGRRRHVGAAREHRRGRRCRPTTRRRPA